jgi:CheY-like chemotaxis protein
MADGSLAANGDKPNENNRDADERRRNRAYDLKLQRLDLCHREPSGRGRRQSSRTTPLAGTTFQRNTVCSLIGLAEQLRAARVGFGQRSSPSARITAVAAESRKMIHSTNDRDLLSGVRVLVVEDDPLLAMDLDATLVGAGAVVVDLCRTLDEALLRADADDFVVAVLDFGLGSETVSPVARRLVDRGVPFVLYTGKSRHEPSMAEWRDCSIVQKPASTRALVSAVRTVLAR